MLAFGLAISSPVGMPCRLRWVSPPGGAGDDRMHVRIVEAGDDRTAVRIDHRGPRSTLPQNLVIGPGGADLAARHGDGFDKTGNSVRCDLGVVKDAVGRHARLLDALLR